MATNSISERSQRIILVLLCCLAFVLRLVVVWRYFATTAVQDFWTFGFEPSHIAAALVRGLGFSSPFTDSGGPTSWLPPIYPCLIALAFKIFGVRSLGALCCMLGLNVVCSAITAGILYRIGLRCFSPDAAFAGALLWAVSPDAVAMSVRIWDISIATMLGLLAVLLYLRLIEDEPRRRDWVMYAVVWSISALTTTTIAAMMPLALVVLFFRQRGRFRKQTCVVFAIVILILVPWTVRNYARFGHLVPVRGNFGAELWMGNHPGVSGPADESMHPLKNDAELADYLTLGESHYVAARQQQATAFIRSDWAGFWRLTWERVVSFWSAPLVMSSAWPAACAVLAWIAMILMLARGTTRIIAVPFASAMFVFPLSYYISHAESYYRSPIEPLISLLAVAALFMGIEALAPRRAAVAPPRD